MDLCKCRRTARGYPRSGQRALANKVVLAQVNTVYSRGLIQIHSYNTFPYSNMYMSLSYLTEYLSLRDGVSAMRNMLLAITRW